MRYQHHHIHPMKSFPKFKSDPCVACSILTRSILVHLESKEYKETSEIFVISFLRLLDSYRVHAPSIREHSGVLDYKHLSPIQDVFHHDHHDEEQLHKAFNIAHHITFPSLSNDDFFKQMAESLKYYLLANQANPSVIIPMEKLKEYLIELRNDLLKNSNRHHRH
jgi:hypothetical protein